VAGGVGGGFCGVGVDGTEEEEPDGERVRDNRDCPLRLNSPRDVLRGEVAPAEVDGEEDGTDT